MSAGARAQPLTVDPVLPVAPRRPDSAAHGEVNTRLICHLPLIVPDKCSFRVGNDTRAPVEGGAWVFDDTIEHERGTAATARA